MFDTEKEGSEYIGTRGTQQQTKGGIFGQMIRGKKRRAKIVLASKDAMLAIANDDECTPKKIHMSAYPQQQRRGGGGNWVNKTIRSRKEGK